MTLLNEDLFKGYMQWTVDRVENYALRKGAS